MARHQRAAVDDLPLSYLEALDEEYWALQENPKAPEEPLREAYTEARQAVARSADAPEADRQLAQVALEGAESALRHDLFCRLHQAKQSALCISGGGIRSATFGLGILQGLAARSVTDGAQPRLLGEIDYLSTVSGGGYLGAWFSAWAAREWKGERGPNGGTTAVIRQLAKNPDVGLDPEPAPVRHLRGYSNYLIPRLGLFSGDTWAVVGTVMRNMFLNWLVLVPLIAFVLLIPVFTLECITPGQVAWIQAEAAWIQWGAVILGFACGVIATAYIGFDLPSAGNARGGHARYVLLCLMPLVLSAVLLNTFWAWLPAGDPSAAWWDVVSLGRTGIRWGHLAVFGAVMHAGGLLVGILAAFVVFGRPPAKTGLIATAAAIATGAIGGLVMYGFIHHVVPEAGITSARVYDCIAFPLLVGVYLFAGALLIGLTSYITEDKDREWWARAGGLLLSIALGWLVFAAVVQYAEQIVDRLTWTVSSGLGLLTGWATSWLGSSADTASGRSQQPAGGTPKPIISMVKEDASRLALPVFIFILVLVLSGANASLLRVVPGSRLLACVLLGAMYLAISLGSSYFINVNSFSLHAMYKLRLARAYLGASNPNRDKGAHKFTGFDEQDDIELHDLCPQKPLHVVNMALNLVGGATLAWQQRKAESFTATRLHAGSCRVGYRPSTEYGGKYRDSPRKKPLSLGTAMTISGAAASPNMGYNSSPLLTLVMTLFNARLGWWLGNPRAEMGYWKYPGPLFGVRPFMDEALGLTDDSNRWVYLSDGGHFDNLGLYEMVMRRCHLIVVCDAGADPTFGFADLGNAVRKVRVDLGVSIDFEGAMPRPFTAGQAPDLATHCAIGRIRYSTVDPDDAPDGTLIYIKASLTGDEPPDVRHYASQNTSFPHQTTTDQFFDETQFESYRRLGLHIVEEISRHAAEGASERAAMDLGEFTRRAERYCRPRAPLELDQKLRT